MIKLSFNLEEYFMIDNFKRDSYVDIWCSL